MKLTSLWLNTGPVQRRLASTFSGAYWRPRDRFEWYTVELIL